MSVGIGSCGRKAKVAATARSADHPLVVPPAAVGKLRAGIAELVGRGDAEAAVRGDKRRPLADAERVRVMREHGAADELERRASGDLDPVDDEAAH